MLLVAWSGDGGMYLKKEVNACNFSCSFGYEAELLKYLGAAKGNQADWMADTPRT